MADTSSAPTTGWNEQAARNWLAGPTASARDEDLRRPWQVAATIIALDKPDVGAVLDVASGPGGFLALMLGEFPGASGVWLDSSEVMRDEAGSRLAGLGGRVGYHLGDILDLGQACGRGSVDAVTSSRATHHLTVPDLGRFYQQAADVLRPGGWVANWDNVTMEGDWGQRLRAARARLRVTARSVADPTHPHVNRSPTPQEHLDAMRAAGFTDPQVVWQEYVQVLVMARKP
jgi:SAM-dependent methyltransferase